MLGKKSQKNMLGKDLDERIKNASPINGMIGPSDESLKKLVEIGVASIVDGYYEYSKIFEESVKDMLEHPPNKLEQIKMANDVRDVLLPLFIARGAVFLKSKRGYDNVVTAFAVLKHHTKLRGIIISDENEYPNLVYATAYLNDNKPQVEVEEDVCTKK